MKTDAYYNIIIIIVIGWIEKINILNALFNLSKEF